MSDEYLPEILAYAKKLNWDYKPASWKDIAKNLEQENQRLMEALLDISKKFISYERKDGTVINIALLAQNKE